MSEQHYRIYYEHTLSTADGFYSQSSLLQCKLSYCTREFMGDFDTYTCILKALFIDIYVYQQQKYPGFVYIIVFVSSTRISTLASWNVYLFSNSVLLGNFHQKFRFSLYIQSIMLRKMRQFIQNKFLLIFMAVREPSESRDSLYKVRNLRSSKSDSIKFFYKSSMLNNQVFIHISVS